MAPQWCCWADVQIIKEKQPFQRVVVSRDEALQMFQENRFKVEILSGLPQDATITLYRSAACSPLLCISRGALLACMPLVPCVSLGCGLGHQHDAVTQSASMLSIGRW